MMTQQISFVLPPYGTATLTLPEHLTPDAFARLDVAVSDALAEPCRDGAIAAAAAANDPGATEFDSWLVHLR